MKTTTYPQYLVRPDDFSVFMLRNDLGEYSLNEHSSHYHKYKLLVDLGFYPTTQEKLPELKKKSELYYKWLTWRNRPDGHGGVKGGTFKKYLEKNMKKT